MPKLKCALCTSKILAGSHEFISHVKTAHCLRSGASYECHYSPGSSLCARLRDSAQFEAHVLNVHIAANVKGSRRDSDAAFDAAESLNDASPKWTVYDCTQNLPALLNDPSRGRREADFFTKQWGDTFVEPSQIEPCSFLPIVKRVHFESFLDRTKLRCKKRARSRATSAEANAHSENVKRLLEHSLEQLPPIFFRPNFDLSDPETFNTVLAPSEDPVNSSPSTDTKVSSSAKSSSAALTKTEPRNGSAGKKPPTARSLNPFEEDSLPPPPAAPPDPQGLNPFEEGPNPFEEKPATPSSSSSSSPGLLLSRKLLQEKLAHLLDLVEVRLASHISKHSDAFFDAMTSQDELAERLGGTLESIVTMREKLAEIELKMVREPLRVLQLYQQRQNMLQVVDKLELMLNVHQAQPTIQVLLANAEFVGALDLIDTTQEILNQELKNVLCFRHLGSQLSEISSWIEKMLQADFRKYSASDLNRPLNSGPQIKDVDQFRAVICGLLRLGKGEMLVRWYQEEAVTAIQAMVKATQIEFVAEINNSDGVNLLEQLKQLEISAWLTLLYRAFNNIEKLLLRIRAVYDLCTEILNSSNIQHLAIPAASDLDNEVQSQANLERNGIESTHASMTSIKDRINGYAGSVSSLNDEGRSDMGDKYLSPSLARMKQLSASKSSLSSTRSENTDAGSLITEGDKSKVEHLLDEMLLEVCNAAHDACAKLVSAKTEDGSLDKMNSPDFISLCQGVESFSSKCGTVCKGRRSTGLRLALQSRANRFVSSFHEQHRDTLVLLVDNESFKAVKVPQNMQDIVTNAVNSSDGLLKMVKTMSISSTTSDATSDVVHIHDESYVVCACVLHLIKNLLEYCQTSIDIPMVAPDLLTRLLDLLRHFNVALYKNVLGPSTVRGFSGPTVSRLLMASRSLELVGVLIPHLKEHFEKLLSKKQQFMMKHFQQVSKDLKEHSQSIEDKVLTLVQEACDAKLNDWVLKAPVPSNTFRGIISILIAVNNSIQSILPESRQVEMLNKCHLNFIPCLRKHLVRLKVTNDGGPLHGMVIQEMTFYAEMLKRNGVPSITFDGLWVNLYNNNGQSNGHKTS